MNLEHVSTYFQSFQVSLSTLKILPNKIKKPILISVAYILTGECANSGGQPLKTEFFPLPRIPASMSEAMNCESYTSASLSQFLRFLFHGFLFRLLWGSGRWGVGVVCHRSFLCPAFSPVSKQSSAPWQK